MDLKKQAQLYGAYKRCTGNKKTRRLWNGVERKQKWQPMGTNRQTSKQGAEKGSEMFHDDRGIITSSGRQNCNHIPQNKKYMVKTEGHTPSSAINGAGVTETRKAIVAQNATSPS